MKWLSLPIALVLIGALGLQAWLRFYPHDFAAAHRVPDPPDGGDQLSVRPNGAMAVLSVDGPPEAALARIDQVIRAAPRTRVVAGSVDEGLITYVTRTAFWGFPDVIRAHATADGDGTRLILAGRQWVGDYDWGVNRGRVTGWLEAAGLPVPPETDGSP